MSVEQHRETELHEPLSSPPLRAARTFFCLFFPPPAPQESHKAFKQLNCFLNLSFLFWLMFYSHAFHVPRAVLLEFCGCCAWAEQRLYYFWAAIACLYLTTVKGLLRNAHTKPHVLGNLSPILRIRFFKTSTHSSQLSTNNLASSCN